MRRLLWVLGPGAAALALAGCGGGTTTTVVTTTVMTLPTVEPTSTTAPVTTAAVTTAAAGTTTEASASGPIAAAARKTSRAKSARVHFQIVIAGVQPKVVRMVGDGAVDPRRRIGKLTFNLGALAAGTPLGAATGGKLVMIYHGTKYFLYLPALKKQGFKPWVRIDVAQLAKQQGLGLGGLSGAPSSDPTQALQYLRGAGNFKKLGRERLRGTPTTAYEGAIDLRKVVRQVPPAQRRALQRAIQQGVANLPTQVWIGDDGFVRRMKVLYPKLPGVAKGSLTLVLDLYDYGASVDAKLPPRNQITNFAQLVKQSKSGG